MEVAPKISEAAGSLGKWDEPHRTGAPGRDSSRFTSTPSRTASHIAGVVLADLQRRRWTRTPISRVLGGLAEHNLVAVLVYVVCLAVPLYIVGKRALKRS